MSSNLHCPECCNTFNITHLNLEDYTPNLCPECGYQFKTGKVAILLNPVTKQNLVNFLLTKSDGEGYSDFIETALRLRSDDLLSTMKSLSAKLDAAIKKHATELKELT